jgi:peroxiredoxin
MLVPRQAVPPLHVPTVAHGDFALAAQAPRHFTLLVFYRGAFCPYCLKQLRELGRLLPDFTERGVELLALSCDERTNAEAMAAKVGEPGLRFGYGLEAATARAWGLHMSRGHYDSEPALFSEPGLFLVRPDGTLYFAAQQTMPFARPHADELLAAIGFAIDKGYPARGELLPEAASAD